VACCVGAGKIQVLFVTAFASGTRQGELLAVQWRYADLDRGVLWILQDLARPRGGGFRFGDVKTGHAKRLVRLRRGLCEVGADWRQQHCLRGLGPSLLLPRCYRNRPPRGSAGDRGMRLKPASMAAMVERATGFGPATIGLGKPPRRCFATVRHRSSTSAIRATTEYLDLRSFRRRSPQDATVRPLSGGCNGGEFAKFLSRGTRLMGACNAAVIVYPC